MNATETETTARTCERTRFRYVGQTDFITQPRLGNVEVWAFTLEDAVVAARSLAGHLPDGRPVECVASPFPGASFAVSFPSIGSTLEFIDGATLFTTKPLPARTIRTVEEEWDDEGCCHHQWDEECTEECWMDDEAANEVRLTPLVHCAECYHESSGRIDYTGQIGPLRGIVSERTVDVGRPAMDRSTVSLLSCGHSDFAG